MTRLVLRDVTRIEIYSHDASGVLRCNATPFSEAAADVQNSGVCGKPSRKKLLAERLSSFSEVSPISVEANFSSYSVGYPGGVEPQTKPCALAEHPRASLEEIRDSHPSRHGFAA